MILIGIALGALFFVFLQDRLFARYWKKNLTVDLAFSEKGVTEGESCTLRETVENRKLLPLPALKVKFAVSRQLVFEDADAGSSVTDQYYRNDVICVRPYMRHVRVLPFSCKRRGYYTIDSLDAVAANLFFSREYALRADSRACLYVYPKLWKEPSFLKTLVRINGEIESRRHVPEDPFAYGGIREYSQRDSLKEINWKATARTGDLKVNQKNPTSLQAVRIFVNLEDGAILRREDMLECSIRMAAGAAAFLLARGLPVALYTNGPDLVTGELVGIAAAGGIGQLDAVRQRLARIDLSRSAPRFVETMQKKTLEEEQETFTLFFSDSMQEDFQELLAACHKKKMPFAWICPVQRAQEGAVRPELREHTHLVPTEGEGLKWNGG